MDNEYLGEALGMIETLGLVGLIEAADAVAKAAKVEIVNYEQSTGALVIIKFRGSVGAVKAAAEAGAKAAQKVGELVSTHIIPAPDSQIEPMIRGNKGIQTPQKPTPPSPPKPSPKGKTVRSDRGKTTTKPVKKETTKPAKGKTAKTTKGERVVPPYEIMLDPKKPKEKIVIDKLKKGGLISLTSHDLRRLAAALKDFPLSRWIAGKAPKKEIVKYIIARGVKFPDSDKIYYADKQLLRRKPPVKRKIKHSKKKS